MIKMENPNIALIIFSFFFFRKFNLYLFVTEPKYVTLKIHKIIIIS
jgi:hypothetical protein